MLEKPTVSKRLYGRCLLFNMLKHNLLSILFLSFTNDFCGKLLGEQSGKFFNGYIQLVGIAIGTYNPYFSSLLIHQFHRVPRTIGIRG